MTSISQGSLMLNSTSKATPNIEHFDRITLEERKRSFDEELNSIATALVIAICGRDYKRKYDRY